MFYHKVKLLKDARFRRLTGVQKGTFLKMLEVLSEAEHEKHRKHGGRTPQLSMEDRLLMALMYWRENLKHRKMGLIRVRFQPIITTDPSFSLPLP